MNNRKKRIKAQRRARRLAQQAWDAADDGQLALAVKIIRRAVEQSPGNPVLWNDQGILLRQLDELEQAAKSFQTAISLVSDFAEPYSHLASIRARQNRVREAVALQAEAVKHAPESATYRQNLAAYRALNGEACVAERKSLIAPRSWRFDRGAINDNSFMSSKRNLPEHAHGPCAIERVLREEFPAVSSAVDGLNWSSIGGELTNKGYALVRELLAPDLCGSLRQLYEDDGLFAKTVVMNKDRFGRGSFRYFRAPIPQIVDAIRRIVFAHVVRIANTWERLLGSETTYAPPWEDFRLRCAAAGQTTPTPLLLRYEAGGFNAPHRDIRGEVFFPIQLAIVLSRRVESVCDMEEEFSGGEFVLCEDPERKKKDRRTIAAGLGDAILFCTRARLVPIAGKYGWQPVKHGVEKIMEGKRYVLAVPFHEYE